MGRRCPRIVRAFTTFAGAKRGRMWARPGNEVERKCFVRQSGGVQIRIRRVISISRALLQDSASRVPFGGVDGRTGFCNFLGIRNSSCFRHSHSCR
ncbi:hypothetical protein HKBW3S43_00318 [Candidatus Hakubella thermalkaliphila]|uniref:Uncharacterized protein n=1 Tax=Candidatus Hakubella thermalkaliphila TaxID=2754717 RepID=A0A6V8Q9U1_9ACTN|nr:hypothetical protein HKBW3S06_00116 [Candidatus Hakubella thermalkaliphila]GFP27668.1 hypothetical protein HKBW3S33_01078 [Candidatus Hakubella thermalkaliphila]GFP34525.1 hypothetical protein HKBW3S43_00318 [Candidatus Hakubella thermalkaliphila]GFP41160.1 hypothetical protein HKBW3C_00286 [Candidatus Hakubella thermalkaliphila]